MLPVIGITLGDPAGVGSEITCKMLANENIIGVCTPVVICDARVFQQGMEVAKAAINFEVIHDIPEHLAPGKIYVYDMKNISPSEYSFGNVSAAAGKAAGEYIERAVELAMKKKIAAIVTNPIHKEAFALGGYGKKYPGHTEMLAGLTNTTKYSMMLACGNLRVFHVTTHVSLLDAVTKFVKKDRILEVTKLAYDTCRDLGIKEPKIGIAGLNPHASDGGLFGSEEAREIIPAIEEANRLGMHAEGPVPADTLFSKAMGGMYDAVVVMYHDQGHIPIKVVGFNYNAGSAEWKMGGVNVTLGLPIIRTSVDHGTAFGKAGQGRADYNSLFEALRYAILLAKTKAEQV